MEDGRQTCAVDHLAMYEVIWYEWFGDVMLVVDRRAEAACPHWVKPYHTRPLTGCFAHAGVFRILTRTPLMIPQAAPTRLPLQMTLRFRLHLPEDAPCPLTLDLSRDVVLDGFSC